MQISSQATADHLSNMRKFKSFGFSLATLDFDNNKYNGLSHRCIGCVTLSLLCV